MTLRGTLADLAGGPSGLGYELAGRAELEQAAKEEVW
jgi:hypothetical protein